MKIGIYAGSFNPIHNAHVAIADKIIDEKLVDKVVFVPVGDGYEKANLVDGYKRVEMVELAIKDNDNLSVSDIEIVNNKMYSYQTLDYFKSKYGNDDIYLIMGSDNLSEFHFWKRYKYILDNYGIVVLLRNGQKKENFKEYDEYKNIAYVEFDFRLSSTEIRENLKNQKYEVASSKINERVFNYIRENRLYE